MTEADLTCNELTELITDYLEKRLPPADLLRFERHLSLCEGCVTYIDQMRTTIQALGSRAGVEIPAAAKPELLQAFRRWKDDGLSG